MNDMWTEIECSSCNPRRKQGNDKLSLYAFPPDYIIGYISDLVMKDVSFYVMVLLAMSA